MATGRGLYFIMTSKIISLKVSIDTEIERFSQQYAVTAGRNVRLWCGELKFGPQVFLYVKYTFG